MHEGGFMKTKNWTQDFLHFIEEAPTSYHAVAFAVKQLVKADFEELREENEWKLKGGQKYFCQREGSLIAFLTPQDRLESALILASHTDSPSFKLKPETEYVKEGMVMLGTEPYGSPLLSSWLNRDLGIAGQVLYTDRQGRFETALVNLRQAPVTIPQLAIHLDRKVNEEGLLLNKQEHLNALAAIDRSTGKSKAKKRSFLATLLKETLPLKELVAHDLFLYPLEKPSRIGERGELLAGYRMDSLASVYPILSTLTQKKKTSQSALYMMALWDHEEVGSKSATGAESPFFSHIFERLALALRLSRENYLRLASRSLCLSVDLSHAIHPNYPERHDPQHKPKLGDGVLIKTSAQKRYATDAKPMRQLIETAKKKGIACTVFSGRSDIPSGTTIGPIQAALTGIPTVDLGIGQLSMHSARELIAEKDLLALHDLLTSLGA